MNKSIFAGLLGLALSNLTLAAEDINLKDVIVVASRVAQSPENVIGDVTVIGREEIERAGQSTFIELLQAQPGIEISSKGGAGQQSSVFLRGTNSNQVVVLIDGMRIGSATTGSTAFANLPLAQIERIEILRGPATSLYGQDAVGGVIQIFTKQGTGAPQLNAAVGYGSYNTEKVAAHVFEIAGELRPECRLKIHIFSDRNDTFFGKCGLNICCGLVKLCLCCGFDAHTHVMFAKGGAAG